MTKPTKWVCAQRRLRSAWASAQSDQSFHRALIWVAKGPRFLHADSEDSDQTGRMPRLIWVFTGHTVTLLVLSCRGSILSKRSRWNGKPSRPGLDLFVRKLVIIKIVLLTVVILFQIWDLECLHLCNIEKQGSKHRTFIFEQRHDKTNKMSVRPAKTQISLGIRPVWSESSLFAWRKLGPLATHWAHSDDSDQTGRMPRLIWVFAGRTLILLVLSCHGSFLWHLVMGHLIFIDLCSKFIFSH